MKVFAFTDTHGNTKSLVKVKHEVQRLKPDLVLCTGDVSVFEQQLKALLSRIQLLRVPVLLLHGNHEGEARLRQLCDSYSRITFLHKEFVEMNGWTFAAFGGGGFDDEYPELERLSKSRAWKALDWKRTVFLSHAPPHNTLLDNVGEPGEEEWHVGSKTLTRLIKREHPLLVVAGHIHETFGASEWVGSTFVCNPGPNGKFFDLEVLAKEAARREQKGKKKKEKKEKEKKGVQQKKRRKEKKKK